MLNDILARKGAGIVGLRQIVEQVPNVKTRSILNTLCVLYFSILYFFRYLEVKRFSFFR